MRRYLKQVNFLHPTYEIAGGTGTVFHNSPGIKSLIRDTDTNEVVVTLVNGDAWAVPWNLCRSALYAAEKPAK